MRGVKKTAPQGFAVLAAAALVVALAGCAGNSPGPASPLSPGASAAAAGAGLATGGTGTTGVSWHKCPASMLTGVPEGSRMRCGSVQVPVNYQQPSGRKITLALSEMPATAPAGQRQGVLLVNPGGPGASGLSLAASVASAVSPSVAADYDIVGFDPRGVGSSVPALTCDASFFQRPRPPYPPANNQAEQVQLIARRSSAGCCRT
jgi:hypothetical protein